MFTDAKEHAAHTLSMQVSIRGQTQRTDEKGIATFEGGAKFACLKDPDGNTLSIARAPRS